MRNQQKKNTLRTVGLYAATGLGAGMIASIVLAALDRELDFIATVILAVAVVTVGEYVQKRYNKKQ